MYAPYVSIVGVFVGTDATGQKAVPNRGNGVYFDSRPPEGTAELPGGQRSDWTKQFFAKNATALTIGRRRSSGTVSVISGNGEIGVAGFSPGFRLLGAHVGVSSGGDFAVPNGLDGVNLFAAHNEIGGPGKAARAVISGNNLHGVKLQGKSPWVRNAFIGTSANGTRPIPNKKSGIYMPVLPEAVYGARGASEATVGAGRTKAVLFELQDSETCGPGARVIDNDADCALAASRLWLDFEITVTASADEMEPGPYGCFYNTKGYSNGQVVFNEFGDRDFRRTNGNVPGGQRSICGMSR